jgi:hypothetical protein
MGNRAMSLVGRVTSVGLAGALVAACSGAPAGDPTVSAGASQDLIHCGTDCTSPPPKNVCSWNPLSSYPSRGSMPPGETGSAKVHSCIAGTAYDQVSNAERWLMQQGCSSPVFWQAYMGAQRAEAWALLCPYSSSVDDYIAGMRGPDPENPWIYTDARGIQAASYLPPDQVEGPPHTNWSFNDANMPPPPWGYYWVIPWECPQGCTSSGCMVQVM